MDKIYEQTMLFDFYGELLTEHQRSVYEDAVYHDLSLSEIAEERGISRQGVHDLLRRCDGILQDYESKLHLVERFAKAKKTLEKIEQLTLPAEDDGTDCTAEDTAVTADAAETESAAVTAVSALQEMKERLADIRKLSQQLLKEL